MPSRCRIRVRLEHGVDRLSVAVADDGPGIPPEHQPLLFERFRRFGTPESDAAGLGLGLYIARAIVEAHGGTIHVDSRFMLWTMDKVDGAHRLLQEMGVTPTAAR